LSKTPILAQQVSTVLLSMCFQGVSNGGGSRATGDYDYNDSGG